MRDSVTRGWSLKPMDAIHLATAKWAKDQMGLSVDEFQTYDLPLGRYDALLGLQICEPYILQPPLPNIK